MLHGLTRLIRILVLAWLSVVSLTINLVAQSTQEKPAGAFVTRSASCRPVSGPSIPVAVTSSREATMFRRLWGIDDIHVRSTASGSLIRFSYRVVDANKAKIFADKRSTPLVIDEKTNLALQVPVMEKIGQLRQVATLQNGKEYWMAFSNKGRYVRAGNRVDIAIGKLRLEGLVVENSVPLRFPQSEKLATSCLSD